MVARLSHIYTAIGNPPTVDVSVKNLKKNYIGLYNAKLVTVALDFVHSLVNVKYNVEFTDSKSCCQLVKNLTVHNLKKQFFSSSSPFGE